MKIQRSVEESIAQHSFVCPDKWNLHGGKTTMLYLNLSGHDIFKKRFGTSPEKHCLTKKKQVIS